MRKDSFFRWGLCGAVEREGEGGPTKGQAGFRHVSTGFYGTESHYGKQMHRHTHAHLKEPASLTS